MKLKWMAFLGICLLVAQASAEGPLSLKTQKEKVSYGIGVGLAREIKVPGIEVDSDLMAQGLRDELSGKKSPILDKEPRRLMNLFLYVAKNLMTQGIDVDLDLMIKGFQDELSGKKLLIPDRELRRMMTLVQGELKRGQEKATLVPAVDNLKNGETFLAENKIKDGVVTLPSGLQYKILRMGDGRKPTEADTVECHYRGALIDGTEFDNSYRRGKPETFKFTDIIPGWREALKLMPVGSKWQLFIRPQLAYGSRGRGFIIGSNETLIFELELLAVK
jgi:FKBP-type peptidyl-prolyl cis-trans isomerase